MAVDLLLLNEEAIHVTAQKKSPDPINQHYVPQCMLELFSKEKNDKGKSVLWVISKDAKKKRKSSIEEIFAKNHLYTKIIGSEKVFTVEKTLGNIEGDFATLYREKISKRLPLSDIEHLNLCAFVATMMQRTLRFKKNIESFYDQRIALVKGAGADAHSTELHVAKLEAEKKDAHKQGLIDSFPEITKMLMKMNVAFFCAEKSGEAFITSDDPCHMFNPDLQWQRFYSPGLGQEHTEVKLALSRNTLLLLSWSNYRGYFPMESSGVDDQNRMTRAYADKDIATSREKMKLVWRSPLPWDLCFFCKFLMKKTMVLINRLQLAFEYGRIR
ncbi:DUF4238 domain-containing protein [Patescibacteria group bacterium]|nr:DUF4238 domain-containing protein [Patescibacteria group bacterium]